MSRNAMNRRHFLTLPLGLLVMPLARVFAAVEPRKSDYAAEVAILYRMFSLQLNGVMDEAIDRAAGRYEVTIKGEGGRIANRIVSRGILRDGRWAPVRTTSWFQVVGRESNVDLAYDYAAGKIDYHFKGETFLMRRTRVARDVLPVPSSHVDDAVSAILNYADGRWPAAEDGTLRTQLVRRRRRPNEGPDDVDQEYKAELIPLTLKVGPDPESKKPTALFDMRGFSSWARDDRPARIVFGPDRRPELITTSLILGTTVDIRFKSVA